MKLSKYRIALAVLLAVGFAGGLAYSVPQHGHGQGHGHGSQADPQAHFEDVATQLELTDAQRDKLKAPFNEAFAALSELHRLHDVIAAELTDDQKQALAQMVHEAMSGGDGGHR